MNRILKLCLVFFLMTLVMTFLSATVNGASEIDFGVELDIIETRVSDNLKVTEIKYKSKINNTKKLSASLAKDKMKLESINIDTKALENSYYAIIHEERIYLNDYDITSEPSSFSNVMTTEYTYKTPEGLPSWNPDVEDTWSTDKYLTIITEAYEIDYYVSGSKVYPIYRIQSYVNYDTPFVLRHTDKLVIRHGENGVFWDGKDSLLGNTNYYSMSGYYYFMRRDVDPNYSFGFIYHYYQKDLTPTYPSIYGVSYDVNLYNYQGSDREYAYGSYYVIATNTTVVQTVYVHNERLFGNALTLDISIYGVSVKRGQSNTTYSAKPLTLRGL